ncbi:MAG: SDR family oxidoreductase [Anaerolineales bacterium]|jgi:NAD(P)-dependent dehydrogenase (short-subunit alcohol dehydrogenase family)
MEKLKNLFDLTGRVAVITGGTGLLGQQHAEAIAQAGGIPVLADIRVNGIDLHSREGKARFGEKACAIQTDITDPKSVKNLLEVVLDKFGRVDILVNNAANNPKMENNAEVEFSRLEFFPLEQWDADLNVGLKGAFLCSQVIGSEMARRKQGVIVNVASDLAVIAPDQRLYRKPGLPESKQPVKPVTYSVVKTGLIGLTRYLATYWADSGIRVNAISPGGVYNNQPDDFVERLAKLIPLGRMANIDEYQAAILFLCSDASSYMTGTNLVIDGGRSCW